MTEDKIFYILESRIKALDIWSKGDIEDYGYGSKEDLELRGEELKDISVFLSYEEESRYLKYILAKLKDELNIDYGW